MVENGAKCGVAEHKAKRKVENTLPHISSLDAGAGFRLIIPFLMGLVTGIKHICGTGVLGGGKLVK